MDTLRALVQFIYTDTLDEANVNIEALYQAADKYDIQVIKKFIST